MIDEPVAYHTHELVIGAIAVVVGVDRSRQRERMMRRPDHEQRVVVRWLGRRIKRMPVAPLVVDDPVLEYSEDVTEDFIRNRGRYRASVRAIQDPPDELRGRELRVERSVHVLRVPYLTEADKAKMTAALMALPDDEDDDGLD